MDDKERALKDMQESIEFAVRRKQQIHEAVPIVNGGASTEESGTHTPGPWAIEELDAAGMEYFIVPDGYRCAIADGVLEGHQDHTIETMRANARLIAAAPELAEALRKIIDRADCRSGAQVSDDVCEIARKALAKLDRTARETSTVAQDK